MARTKPTPTLITRAQVESHLQRYGLLQGKSEIIRAVADEQISLIRAQMERDVAPIIVEISQIEAEINHHIRTFRADFVGPRTLKNRFGEFGLRKIRSDAISIARSLTKSIIAQLKSLKMDDCLRIEEKIDARQLATYPDSVIAKIDGVSRPPESEEPWFEAFREPIQ